MVIFRFSESDVTDTDDFDDSFNDPEFKPDYVSDSDSSNTSEVIPDFPALSMCTKRRAMLPYVSTLKWGKKSSMCTKRNMKNLVHV